MPIMSSLVSPEVIAITYGATTDDTVGIMTTLLLQWPLRNLWFWNIVVIVKNGLYCNDSPGINKIRNHHNGEVLLWRHNGRDGVSNHQPHEYLLNSLFRRRSKKTSNLRVTGLCVGNSAVIGEFPAQMASNTENVSISWRHNEEIRYTKTDPEAYLVIIITRASREGHGVPNHQQIDYLFNSFKMTTK